MLFSCYFLLRERGQIQPETYVGQEGLRKSGFHLMADNSFDIVSQVDLQEVDNAVQQTLKEISQRFDFKGKLARVEYDRQEKKISLTAENDYLLKAIGDILQGKTVKRQISLKSLSFGELETNISGVAKQTVTVQQGIPQEKAKAIVKAIKEMGLKVQSQIQGEEVRVSGKKKDDLQAVIERLHQQDFGIALQFTNYR